MLILIMTVTSWWAQWGNKSPASAWFAHLLVQAPVTGGFPAQKASNIENITIWWRHHEDFYFVAISGTFQLIAYVIQWSRMGDKSPSKPIITQFTDVHMSKKSENCYIVFVYFHHIIASWSTCEFDVSQPQHKTSIHSNCVLKTCMNSRWKTPPSHIAYKITRKIQIVDLHTKVQHCHCKDKTWCSSCLRPFQSCDY